FEIIGGSDWAGHENLGLTWSARCQYYAVVTLSPTQLISFIFLERKNRIRQKPREIAQFRNSPLSASSERWVVKRESDPLGQKSEPHSLSHIRGGNEADEAD